MDEELRDLLPDEVLEVLEAPAKNDAQELATLAQELVRMRDAAVKARADIGIEDIWRKYEEAYIGIDDENRHEFQGAKWAKPMSMDGPLVKPGKPASDEVRATVFIPLTRRYVEAAHSKVCEIALPLDGKPFALKATPVPEMLAAKEDTRPASAVSGRPMPRPDGSGEVTVGELAASEVKRAEAAAEKASDQIYDWLAECKHNAQMRCVVFDGARIGTGVLEGPVPEISRGVAVRKVSAPPQTLAQTSLAKATTAYMVEIVEKTKPVTRWIDVWNFFPAPGCGEEIHRGGHCFVLDTMLPDQLAELAEKKGQGYLPEVIREVLAEGPLRKHSDAASDQRTPEQQGAQPFEVWRFHGKISRAAFRAANPQQDADLPEAMDRVFCIATVVNDRVIRAVLPALESDRLPFHVFTWSRRKGHWAGVGIGEQVEAAQRIANSAWRRLLGNAGQSSGAQVVMRENAVYPANSRPQITPDKLWYLRDDSGIDDVRKAFGAFQWPNTTPQMMSIIEAAYKLAEESTNVPLVTQGQSGDTTPDTFSGAQLQDNNANQLLRSVGFRLNDQVTSPSIDQLYEYLLLDPEVPNDCKGDYKVDTSGALAIIEKALEAQTLPVLVQMSKDPAYDLHPGRCMEAWLRSKRLVPAHFQLTDEEKEQRAKQPPPEPPQVTAAKINADARMKAAGLQAQTMQTRIKVDTDRDTLNVQAQTERTAMERDTNLRELMLKRELAILEHANKRAITVDQAKVELAKLTMELNLQRELAGADGEGPQVADPLVEPEGRAPDGQAFQK